MTALAVADLVLVNGEEQLARTGRRGAESLHPASVVAVYRGLARNRHQGRGGERGRVVVGERWPIIDATHRVRSQPGLELHAGNGAVAGLDHYEPDRLVGANCQAVFGHAFAGEQRAGGWWGLP